MLTNDDHLNIRLARGRNDLIAAQRLRYQVFVEEMGANGAMVDHVAGLEADPFDAHCQHLILVDERRDATRRDHVVGVYRMLDQHAANRAGGFYSQGEFDLSPLLGGKRNLLELGRSCVHAEYRNGMALYRLWHGLGALVVEQKIDVLFGVASFSGTDPNKYAQTLSYLHHHHLAPQDLRLSSLDHVFASDQCLPVDQVKRAVAVAQMPALIKAYLRIGGYIGQGVFVDHGFNTTDICMVLDTKVMNARQRRIYGGAL